MELRQSGVIPFRLNKGHPEILLITSTRGDRWIVPKGQIERHLTPEESARQEAYEEAGVSGELLPGEFGAYRYTKFGTPRRVSLYLFQVRHVLERWEESHIRKRVWATEDEAERLVSEPSLLEIIRRAFRLLKSEDGVVKDIKGDSAKGEHG